MRRSRELVSIVALLGALVLGGAFAYGEASLPGPLPMALLPIAPAGDADAPAAVVSQSPHWTGAVSPNTGVCATCHRTHAASGPGITASDTEEGLCFTCHQAQEAQMAKPYAHEVDAYLGQHAPRTAWSEDDLSSANRHVECQDCHSAHRAQAGTHTPGTNAASPALAATWGVEWTETGWEPVDPATEEHQVCLKCHSSYAAGAPVDLAVPTDPQNASYHPVRAAGKNPDIPSSAFVSPWTAGSLMYCSDCHSGDAGQAGPHGSTNPWLLRAPFSKEPYWSGDPQDSMGLCFTCHESSVYYDGYGHHDGSGFPKHTMHVRSKKITCYTCHASHGRTDEVHLIRLKEPWESVGILAFTHDESGGECTATCHKAKDYEHGS